MRHLGFAISIASIVVIIVLLVGLGYGLDASTSGEWWATSLLGVIGGFLLIILGDLTRGRGAWW